MPIPRLEASRLVLRPFSLSDAKSVQKLAGDKRIAATTAAVPHPYLDGMAEEWISQHAGWFDERRDATFAIELRTSAELIGCISLMGISKTHAKAEMGYWIGVDYWNQGFATEAAKQIIKFGFTELELNRIVARHMASNPQSGKVMIKAGMKKEAYLRQDFFRDGAFYDMVVFGILKSDF